MLAIPNEGFKHLRNIFHLHNFCWFSSLLCRVSLQLVVFSSFSLDPATSQYQKHDSTNIIKDLVLLLVSVSGLVFSWPRADGVNPICGHVEPLDQCSGFNGNVWSIFSLSVITQFQSLPRISPKKCPPCLWLSCRHIDLTICCYLSSAAGQLTCWYMYTRDTQLVYMSAWLTCPWRWRLKAGGVLRGDTSWMWFSLSCLRPALLPTLSL